MPDLTQAPPCRYRVVERGRRLEVIDTRRSVRRTAARPPGGLTIRTSPMWDAKGPRRVILDANGSRRIGATLGVLLVALALLAVGWIVLPWPSIVVTGLLIGLGNQQGKGLVAKWLDRIGTTLP